MKKDDRYKKQTVELGKIFVKQYKEAIVEGVERLTGKDRKELKYITVNICFSWKERLGTIIESYNCVVYEHELCSLDDRIADMIRPPHPDLMKDLYITVGGKQISTAVRFFDPV